jgi:5-formaminoimidazole-4-carboxamide-1-beta-D-ribofuranosyl 5'-monophosphate synthetase
VPITYELADRMLNVSKFREELALFNVKTLPRESIMPITYELADRMLKVSKFREEPGPFNVKTLPRESIMPITYELADRMSNAGETRTTSWWQRTGEQEVSSKKLNHFIT